ncbi:MAG TPA: hypothetical protein VFB35_02330, partial [Gaiellaceae bacterium]|nr:hypothetical protein [Gaiellaceae bacterium]
LEDGWLRDQALGLRTYAGMLAGEELAYADEVERCYGVRPELGDTDVYRAVHEELDRLLPGEGPISERYQAWRSARTIPAGSVLAACREAAAELRAATAGIVDLPEGEELVIEGVTDEPWWAFNYYLGDLRSRVVVNLDVPTTCRDVVHLAGHEVYPGHHTEHAVKEHVLIRGQGKLEESIQMVPTPSVVVSEGLAEAGPGLVRNGDVDERLAAGLRRHGLDYDVRTAEAVAEARRPLRRVSLDAALMIHDGGASVAEAEEYIAHWSLMTADEAAHSVSFVVDPAWRAYVVTYSAGRDLCERWVQGDPARLARLLTEQIRVGELVRGA